jgi:23S rRNA pseudouridine1911/1915/1917 synthase
LTVRLGDRLRALYPGASGRARKQWLTRGRVRVNDRVVKRADVEIAGGDRVMLGAPPPPPFPSPLRSIHEDAAVLVVNKPPGLLTMATERGDDRTAYRLLAAYVGGHGPARRGARPGPRLFIVHRLDRETSGLLVFAKSPAAKRRLQEQFEARAVERVYVAVVEGRPAVAAGVLEDRLRENASLRVVPTRDRRGKEAITRYRVLEQRAQSALVELRLVTGRRGQLRAQLAKLGHPVVGDREYGSRRDPLGRLCLHATRLGFVHPDGRRVTFESPPPASFARA